jgi:hypothetical protein
MPGLRPEHSTAGNTEQEKTVMSYHDDLGELALPGICDPDVSNPLLDAVRAAQSGRVIRITDPDEGGDIMARIVPAYPKDGPDRMAADVRGDSYEDLIEAARAEARNFYGPDAPLGIERVGIIRNTSGSGRGGHYWTTVTVRCTRMPEGWDVP